MGIWQLRKIRIASDAAAAAAEEIKDFAKSRSSLVDLVGAVSLLDTIKAHLTNGSFEASIIYLDQLRARVISARRLLRLDEKERQQFDLALLSIRKSGLEISQQMNKSKKESDVVMAIALLDDISDVLNHYLAPLRIEQEIPGEPK